MLKTLLRILITSQLQQTSYLYTWVLDCVTSVSFSPQPHCQFFSISLPSTATAAKSLQSCPTLSDSMDCSPPGSSVPGILQARILTWVAISFSQYFTAAAAAAKSLQSCPTLCDPIDGSSPGSPIPGILRQEHWSALPFPSTMHESEK